MGTRVLGLGIGSFLVIFFAVVMVVLAVVAKISRRPRSVVRLLHFWVGDVELIATRYSRCYSGLPLALATLLVYGGASLPELEYV
jgi:hypothetical protein